MSSLALQLAALLNVRGRSRKVEPAKTPTLLYKSPNRRLRRIEMDLDGMDPESSPPSYSGAVVTTESQGTPCAVLPPELLSLIFLYAKPPKRVAHKIPLEVTVSHVSRFWRAVALGTPVLWSRIDIYSKRSQAWVVPYLQRSLQRPLDVYIDIYRLDASNKAPNPLAGFRLLLEVLPRNFYRLRLFSLICFRQTTAVHWQTKFKNERTPILRSFSIKYGSNFGNVHRDFAPLASILEGSSHDHLTFLETDTPNILPAPDILSSLTTLYLHGLDPSLSFTSSTFMQTFASLPSLVNLSMQGTIAFGFWPEGMPLMPQCTLGRLKSLRLLDGGGLAMRMLLSVSAPLLETLWLDCSFDNFPNHLFDAVQFNITGQPKFPNLKYLTTVMDDFVMSSRFATIFPTVTHLHYLYANFREVKQLIPAFNLPRWPSVQVLVFSAFREKDAGLLNTALLRILSERIQKNSPLSRILVDKDHHRWLETIVPEEARKLRRIVEIALLSSDNYTEYWWDTFERNSKKSQML